MNTNPSVRTALLVGGLGLAGLLVWWLVTRDSLPVFLALVIAVAVGAWLVVARPSEGEAQLGRSRRTSAAAMRSNRTDVRHVHSDIDDREGRP